MDIDPGMLKLLPLWFVAFLLSLTCHEAAHALVAKLGGDRTAEEAGQVTLHPWPHMKREPLGTIVFPLVTYFLNGGGWMIGWASAPFDPMWASRHHRRAAWMAAAGPAANFVLVLVAGLIIQLGLAGGWLQPGLYSTTELVVAGDGTANAATSFLSVVFTLNLILGTFNLLPVPPLDGHAVLGLFMDETTARKWTELAREPMFAILGLLLAWKVFGWVFRPIFGFAVGLLF